MNSYIKMIFLYFCRTFFCTLHHKQCSQSSQIVISHSSFTCFILPAVFISKYFRFMRAEFKKMQRGAKLHRFVSLSFYTFIRIWDLLHKLFFIWCRSMLLGCPDLRGTSLFFKGKKICPAESLRGTPNASSSQPLLNFSTYTITYSVLSS